MESVETENKNKQRIKTNQCAPGWARNSQENRSHPVFLCFNSYMNQGTLRKYEAIYDEMQTQYGDPNFCSIHFGGCTERPKLALVFMNPTARNIATHPDWQGLRAPWVGTKNVWSFLCDIDVISKETLAAIRTRKGADWSPEFATQVYDDVAAHGVFITNLAKCTQKDARPLPDRVFEQYREYLMGELACVRPEQVILFGNQVSSIVLQQKISVSQCRKSNYQKAGLNFWPVYYPVGNGFMNVDKAIEDICFILAHY